MNQEKEIVLELLSEAQIQLEKNEFADIKLNYEHPKWGSLAFRMRTKIRDVNRISLVFSINECWGSLGSGNKKIGEIIRGFINNPEPILSGITTKYRMLFDYT